MAQSLPPSIQRLIEEFSRLPGVGPKTAERLTMHLLHSPHSRIKDLGDSILGMKDGVEFCSQCWHLSDEKLCGICRDTSRDHGVICVVEQVLDIVAIERAGSYKGVYHVLHGILSPMDGIGPEDLKLYELEQRVKNGGVQEVVLGINPSIEGEATVFYIRKMLTAYPDVAVTRFARGLPVGGELGYADEITIMRAVEGRVRVE